MFDPIEEEDAHTNAQAAEDGSWGSLASNRFRRYRCSHSYAVSVRKDGATTVSAASAAVKLAGSPLDLERSKIGD
jgi:hypothetical protein